MMMDDDIVAASPSSIYRVLKAAGLLDQWSPKPSKKGTGFIQPLKPHEHWHIDISYLNLGGTFYYMCSILDGCSRYIVHWDIREAMKETDIELIVQQAREKFEGAKPRMISDNGPQFIAKDFKEFVRLTGMTHVKTSPYYPQSNGKIERYHRTIKSDCIRSKHATTLEQAKANVREYVKYYNEVRLHSAIGYVTPMTKLLGQDKAVQQSRETKLAAARQKRKAMRQQARTEARGQVMEKA